MSIRRMAFRFIFVGLPVAVLIPGCPAGAQVSAYGTIAATDYGFVVGSTEVTKSDSPGFIVGAFYNFPIQSRLTAGIDARGSYSPGERGGSSAAAALRIGFVPERVVLRPYFQLGGGVVSSTPDDRTVGDEVRPIRYTSGGLEFALGLDIRLTPSFDLRALEIGAIAGSGSVSSPGAGSGFVNAGIVYHFR
jgi:hypothetical protein